MEMGNGDIVSLYIRVPSAAYMYQSVVTVGHCEIIQGQRFEVGDSILI